MSSISSKNDKKFIGKVQKTSKVLLVCVYDTVVFEITNETILKKFDKFGTITKLLIFQKGQVSKFFIEYEEVDQAVKAKSSLDGTKLCDSICKMTIYYSNFSNVDIKHQPPEYINQYSSYAQKFQSEHSFEHTKGSNKEKSPYLPEYEDDESLLDPFSGAFSSFSRSKTDNPKTLQEEILKMGPKKETRVIREEEEIQHNIKQSIDSIIGPDEKMRGNYGYKRDQIEEAGGLKFKSESDVRSSILWFVYRYSVQPKQLYNLFSNFGNISCLIIKKEHIYLKFRTKQFAAIALTYLNGTVLQGNILQLRECPESATSWSPKEGQYCQCIYYDASYDRFTPQRSITINPPSPTLHVSSMKKQICKEPTLKNIFSQYGQVERIHILQQSNEKNMALVRFRSMEDSFSAISHLHNEAFNGRKMQISFTKSKV